MFKVLSSDVKYRFITKYYCGRYNGKGTSPNFVKIPMNSLWYWLSFYYVPPIDKAFPFPFLTPCLRQYLWSPLLHVMALWIIGTKPLPKQISTYRNRTLEKMWELNCDEKGKTKCNAIQLNNAMKIIDILCDIFVLICKSGVSVLNVFGTVKHIV